MKTLDQVLTDVLQREGWPAVTDRPADRGGLTRGGVTLDNYNAWRVSRGDAPITADQLRNLSEVDARAFLADQFGRPFAFVGDEGVFVLLVDWAVTSGPDDPTRALQKALQAVGHYAGAVDGAPGPATRAAWVAVHGDLTLCDEIEKSVLAQRRDFYVRLALADPDVVAFIKAHPATQLRNLRGWLNRCDEFA